MLVSVFMSVGQTMNGISSPWMRAQLVDLLKGLSNYDYQKGSWGVFRGSGLPYDELGYAVHFFYDDTVLSHDPSSLIGSFLLDGEEVVAVTHVIAALDVIFAKYGLDLPDAAYIEKPEWASVLVAASKALEIIQTAA